MPESVDNPLPRRRFLRQAGGASVGTLVALHFADIAHAQVSYLSASSDIPSSKRHWKIRAAGPDPVSEPSTAMPVWNATLGCNVHYIREVTITGTVGQFDGGVATNTITVVIKLTAEVSFNGGAYVPATGAIFSSLFPGFTSGNPPKITVVPSITKTINTTTGQVTSTTNGITNANGDVVPPDDPNYDNTGADLGMSYTITWDMTNGKDKVIVAHSGGSGVPGNTTSYDAKFEIKPFSIQI
jgi:hypothetical protein